jgi:CBS domain-containing protein
MDYPKYVRDLMTSMVTTVGRNENLKSADDVMRLGRIRHLPCSTTTARSPAS